MIRVYANTDIPTKLGISGVILDMPNQQEIVFMITHLYQEVVWGKKTWGITVILLRRIGYITKEEGSLLWTRFSLVPRSEHGLITRVHQVWIVCTFFSVVSPRRNTVHML